MLTQCKQRNEICAGMNEMERATLNEKCTRSRFQASCLFVFYVSVQNPSEIELMHSRKHYPYCFSPSWLHFAVQPASQRCAPHTMYVCACVQALSELYASIHRQKLLSVRLPIRQRQRRPSVCLGTLIFFFFIFHLCAPRDILSFLSLCRRC